MHENHNNSMYEPAMPPIYHAGKMAKKGLELITKPFISKKTHEKYFPKKNQNFKKEFRNKDFSGQIRNYSMERDPIANYGVQPRGSQYMVGEDGSVYKANDESWKYRDNAAHILSKVMGIGDHSLSKFQNMFGSDGNIMER